VGADIVLCDIGLPDIAGYEVARTLRRDEDLRGTRLVAVSGYAQPEDRKMAHDAGFDDHIAKPPDLDELKNIIAT
jgi:CheY-like chemotaxis protein